MPTSNLALWPTILNLIETVPHERILDVGPGYGKGAQLAREYLNVKPERVDAVEAWPGYVTDRLQCLYDAVYVQDVRTLSDVALRYYDLVLMVEVLEHLPKEDGFALLDRIPGRVVICTPETFFPNPSHLPPTEKHRSLWAVEDFGDRLEVDASEHGGVVVRLGPRE